MKKTLLFLLTAAIGVSLCAPAQTVTSVNAVGMVKITVPANGGFFLARYDFVPPTGEPAKVTDILGLNVPVGTKIFVWNRGNQAYETPITLNENFLGQKSWSNTAITIGLGDAFFIQNASSAASFDVTMSGEVPGASNSTETVQLDNLYGFMGYPFPVEVLWTNTQLADDLPVGAAMFVWDPLVQNYLAVATKNQNFLGQISWSQNPTIKPGHGFWITTTGTLPPVIEVKPYLWP